MAVQQAESANTGRMMEQNIAQKLGELNESWTGKRDKITGK